MKAEKTGFGLYRPGIGRNDSLSVMCLDGLQLAERTPLDPKTCVWTDLRWKKDCLSLGLD